MNVNLMQALLRNEIIVLITLLEGIIRARVIIRNRWVWQKHTCSCYRPGMVTDYRVVRETVSIDTVFYRHHS